MRALLLTLGVLMLGVPALAVAGDGEKSSSSGYDRAGNGVYVVRMLEQPVVAYQGGTADFKPTKPAKGKRLDRTNPDVQRYAAHLDAQHDDAAGNVSAKKLYDYRYSFNGFAAKLSSDQVTALERRPDVLSVEKDRMGHPDTATTPSFLGLDAPGGLWSRLGGKGHAGDEIIIGVVDTGIWPEHPSFSAKGIGDSTANQQGQREWRGTCQTGEQWTTTKLCNGKIIGARYFTDGFGLSRIADRDFISARDWNGHGSHTSSTAGGDASVPATGPAALFGSITGMAPKAQIAMYKVCWEDSGDGGCATSDSVAAIDQAVADGVDVINYSISGTSTNYLDAVEVSFLFAADAGVFVATSAGNSGPGAGTVAHISPWLAAVAAGTHNRSGTATATLGNGVTYTGASLTDAVGPAQLIASTSVGKTGADANQVRLCFLGTLDPAKTAGKIVQCDRGVNARTEKSAAVKEAGGVGMILTNTGPNSLNADLHSVPTVHVADTDRGAIQAYIAANGAAARATLSKAVVNTAAPAPEIAAFSSRGASRAGGGDILKPDFMAPGVDVLAAVAPPGNGGRLFDLYSGTSMASPHVAGIAALLRQAHFDWSPAMIRSALATTASPAVSAGTNSPYAIGSGQIVPNKAVDPGLVYDAGFSDYLAFLKGQRLCCASSASIPALDASDLNQPSIAIGDLAGSQTVKRTVTNVGSGTATYNAGVTAPAGFTVSVSPTSFTIAPGATKTYEVTITRTDAPTGTSRFGQLVWSDGTHSVRSVIVARAVDVAAPAEIKGSGVAGSATYSIQFGRTSAFSVTRQGAIPAVTDTRTVVDDPTNNFNTDKPDSNQGIQVHTVSIPAGTTYARFSTFDAFVDGATDDLDLYVYNSAGQLVGNSGGGTAEEEVNLVAPPAGTYKVYVHGWQTDGPDAVYTLFSWLLSNSSAGNLTVTAPSSGVLGTKASIKVDWAGLTAGKKYLGRLVYGDGTNTFGATVVRIDG